MPTFSGTFKGYSKLWDEAEIKDARKDELLRIADKSIRNKERYRSVEQKTGCPWYVIAAIHMRESSQNFQAHLHEGSPLTARTRNIPKGRPKTGNPPFSWEESAIDALTVPPHDMRQVGRWSVERMLYELEKYNGWGYMGKGNSPYVWAGTTNYRSGKYVRDGLYDPTHVDTQQGTAAIIKMIATKDSGVAARLKDREASPPRELVDEEKKDASKTAKKTTGAGTVISGGSGGGGLVTGFPAEAVAVGVGMGLAILTLGVFLWVRSHKKTEEFVNAAWTGNEVAT